MSLLTSTSLSFCNTCCWICTPHSISASECLQASMVPSLRTLECRRRGVPLCLLSACTWSRFCESAASEGKTHLRARTRSSSSSRSLACCCGSQASAFVPVFKSCSTFFVQNSVLPSSSPASTASCWCLRLRSRTACFTSPGEETLGSRDFLFSPIFQLFKRGRSIESLRESKADTLYLCPLLTRRLHFAL